MSFEDLKSFEDPQYKKNNPETQKNPGNNPENFAGGVENPKKPDSDSKNPDINSKEDNQVSKRLAKIHAEEKGAIAGDPPPDNNKIDLAFGSFENPSKSIKPSTLESRNTGPKEDLGKSAQA